MPSAHREAHFANKAYEEPLPLPKDVPPVDEIGCSSAALESVGFHLDAYCKPYNEDFVLCKNESSDPAHCLKEGRRVTRCAAEFIRKLKENCGAQWQAHYECLDVKNHHLWQCRTQERPLNECIFAKLGVEKTIPETPAGQTQVHLKEKPMYH